MKLSLPESARTLSDAQWLDLLIQSTSSSVVAGIQFPGFPPDELQSRFVGSSNKAALQEAFKFYEFVKRSTSRYDEAFKRSTRVLDFGCGWGRFLRIFWKDIDDENLYGCDVNEEVVTLCGELQVPGDIRQIEPLGYLPYGDRCFDAMFAYSVFTHLPETVHLHWMRELARVARSGCIFCLTLESRRFIDFIGDIGPNAQHEWHRELARHKPRVREFRRAYDSGELVFMPTNEGVEDTYGDAAVPLSFIERNWSPYFEILDYVDNPRRFWQAALVVRRS